MGARRQSKVPKMVRGTVFVHRRKCGKANCRCASSEAGHPATVLSYSEGSRTKFLMLPAGEVDRVRAATQRYRQAREMLEAEGNAGLAELVARLRRPRKAG